MTTHHDRTGAQDVRPPCTRAPHADRYPCGSGERGRRRLSFGAVCAALMVLAVAQACAPGMQQQREGAPHASTLTVHNTHWEDVAIYLERAGTLIRVGTVGSMESRVFVLNPAQVGSGRELRLVAEPRVSRERRVSVAFTLARGQDVRWEIGSRPSLSVLVVR